MAALRHFPAGGSEAAGAGAVVPLATGAMANAGAVLDGAGCGGCVGAGFATALSAGGDGACAAGCGGRRAVFTALC
jgi:hypothetical protein